MRNSDERAIAIKTHRNCKKDKYSTLHCNWAKNGKGPLSQ